MPSRSLVALKSWWLMISAAPVSRSFCTPAFFSASADSSSRSTSRKPASAALISISCSATTLPGNLPPCGGAAAGGDGGRRHVVGEELLEPGQREQRLIQVVEAELEERVLLHCGGGFLDHLGRCRTDNGDADLGEAGAE